LFRLSLYKAVLKRNRLFIVSWNARVHTRVYSVNHLILRHNFRIIFYKYSQFCTRKHQESKQHNSCNKYTEFTVEYIPTKKVCHVSTTVCNTTRYTVKSACLWQLDRIYNTNVITSADRRENLGHGKKKKKNPIKLLSTLFKKESYFFCYLK